MSARFTKLPFLVALAAVWVGSTFGLPPRWTAQVIGKEGEAERSLMSVSIYPAEGYGGASETLMALQEASGYSLLTRLAEPFDLELSLKNASPEDHKAIKARMSVFEGLNEIDNIHTLVIKGTNFLLLDEIALLEAAIKKMAEAGLRILIFDGCILLHLLREWPECVEVVMRNHTLVCMRIQDLIAGT